MSTTTVTPAHAEADEVITRQTVRQRRWKLAVSLVVATVLIGIMAFAFPRDGISTYRLGDRTSTVDLGDIGLPTFATVAVCFVLLVIMTAYAVWAAYSYRRPGLWLPIVFSFVAVFAFLTWSAADGLVPVTGLLFGAVSCRCRWCSALSVA